MKISYSIAILLSCTLAQLAYATSTGATHDNSAGFRSRAELANVHLQKRNVNYRYLSTALRRRQSNTLSTSVTVTSPSAPVAATRESQVHAILGDIRTAIKTALASGDDSNDEPGSEEESKGREEKLEEKQHKKVIKAVKKLIKAINELLKAAGCENEALDMEGVLKSAEDGTLAAPTPNKSMEARGLDALFKTAANLDRNLMADVENDGGDDGSTEGDDQHHAHKKQPTPAKANNAAPSPGTAPAAPATPAKVKDSDGGTAGDDEERHANPAKKRSSDEPDPKEIKSAANELTNILDELQGASGSLEDENSSGLSQLVTLVQKLVDLFNKP